jgi:hypothetical protein
MAYKPDEMTSKKQNYLLFERNKMYSAVYMNSFKTVGRYGKMVYRLSQDVTKIISKLHPNDAAKVLFPMQSDKLSQFLINALRKIEMFKDEPGLGIKYLRHSLVSTKLMHINPKSANYDEQVLNLAESAMHSVKMQEAYTSPLKSASGKIVNSGDGESVELFNEWLKNINDIPIDDLQPAYDNTLIGAEIRKEFKDPKTKKLRMYTGRVVATEDGYYKVVYEDGDLEDLSEEEVLQLMVKPEKP